MRGGDGKKVGERTKGGRQAGRVGHSKGAEGNRVHHEEARVSSSSIAHFNVCP